MRVAIVTSGDYVFAAGVCRDLERSGVHAFMVDVAGQVPNVLRKQFKLALLFGPLALLRCLLASYRNKRALRAAERIIFVERDQLLELLGQRAFDHVVLVNYPWKISPLPGFPILNCHPSLLPRFRGLTPIPHALLTAWATSSCEPIGMTLHAIDDRFDQGVSKVQLSLPASELRSVFDAYDQVYALAVPAVCRLISGNAQESLIRGGSYFREMAWPDVGRLKLAELRRSGFWAFILNGGVIGLLSWALQLGFFALLSEAGLPDAVRMAVSVWCAFFIALVANFASQRWLVFSRPGFFRRFVLATTAVITAVGGLSAGIFELISSFSDVLAQALAYPIAAVALAPISFYLKSRLVFPVRSAGPAE